LNPWTLGLMASTITTRPPRTITDQPVKTSSLTAPLNWAQSLEFRWCIFRIRSSCLIVSREFVVTWWWWLRIDREWVYLSKGGVTNEMSEGLRCHLFAWGPLTSHQEEQPFLKPPYVCFSFWK
jgi:hypothetical protein